MAGLLQQGMNPQQPAQAQPQQAPPQQPPQQPQQEGQQRNPMAAPGEAKPMVGALVERLLTFLYEKGSDTVAQILEREGNISNLMGEILGMIMVTVYNGMAQKGKTIPPNVMVQAGMELSKAVGEMAMEMGRLPRENNAEAIESAFMLGLGKLGKNADQEAMSPEERQAYKQIVEALMSGREKAMGGGQPQGQPMQSPQQPQGPQGLMGGQPMNGGR